MLEQQKARHVTETAPEFTGLLWSIKRSFLMYIARLNSGYISAEGGASNYKGSFLFEYPSDASRQDPNVLNFRGGVQFTGHHGMLSLKISDPMIKEENGKFTLFVKSNLNPDKNRAFVNFTMTELAPKDGFYAFRGEDVRLHESALDLFDNMYEADEQFEDFVLCIPQTAREKWWALTT